MLNAYKQAEQTTAVGEKLTIDTSIIPHDSLFCTTLETIAAHKHTSTQAYEHACAEDSPPSSVLRVMIAELVKSCEQEKL